MTTDANASAPAAGRAPAAPLAMSVFRSFDELAPLRDEWDRFLADAGAGVYLCHDNCAAWWARYGKGRSLHVLVFRAGAELVGVLPMFVDRRWLGPVWLRMGAFLVSDSTLPVLDVTVRAPWAREALATMLRHLLGDLRCDAVRLAPLSDAGAHLGALREAAGDLGNLGSIVSDTVVGPYTLFGLPATFDEYLASLGKSHRSNFRRGMKQLREAHRVEVDVIVDPRELEAEFANFRTLHDEQWRAEGKLGHFGDWPASDAYHRDLVRLHGARGRAHLYRIRLDGETVSYQMAYSLGTSLHWFMPARSLRPDLDRFSMGRLGLVQMIELAIGAGFRQIEGGVGHYDYKLQLGAAEHGVRSFVVAARRSGASLRLAIFLRLSRALDFVYYRGWFSKIAPGLPLRRGPLWKTWIRSRL